MSTTPSKEDWINRGIEPPETASCQCPIHKVVFEKCGCVAFPIKEPTPSKEAIEAAAEKIMHLPDNYERNDVIAIIQSAIDKATEQNKRWAEDEVQNAREQIELMRRKLQSRAAQPRPINSLEEWKAQATKGTSGDMVWDILRDWERSRASQPRCPHCGTKTIYIECHDPHTQCGAQIPAPFEDKRPFGGMSQPQQRSIPPCQFCGYGPHTDASGHSYRPKSDTFRKHWPVGQETTLANPVTIAGHQDDE
jgi:hypothetical protein